jgi:microcystin-dependent protein
MGTPYIGEIRMFAGNFAPSGWFLCQGQLLPISQFEVLYNLIGTTYGGDGQTNFALPDLRSRAPVHMGQGQGTSAYVLAQTGGVETVSLSSQQIPSHNHLVLVNNGSSNFATPGNHVLGNAGNLQVYSPTAPSQPMNNASLQSAGGSQPHQNLQPYLAINFIIAWVGVFPSPT